MKIACASALWTIVLLSPSALMAQELITLVPAGAAKPAVPRVVPNDNRIPGGTLVNGVLTLRLVVQMSEWRPEAEDGPSVVAAAFAEEGKQPQIPAPLVRVPIGTRVRTTVRNALADSAIFVHAIGSEPDSVGVRILPGHSHTFERVADRAGTHAYRAFIGVASGEDLSEQQQLSGAFHVDSGPPRADERIFVINILSSVPEGGAERVRSIQALAINGRSWPHTERIRQTVGDTVRWIVVNGSVRVHPMHLHGFYFRVTGRNHKALVGDEQDNVVTERMGAFTTIAVEWVPDRPGNWLFHCHLVFHVVPEVRLPDGKAHDSGHDKQHMAGLVLGIEVSDSTPHLASRPTAKLRLVAGRRETPGGPVMGYMLDDGRPAEVTVPGPTLVLTRNVPTQVTVVNRLGEPTGVHWHGLELESYSDGVAGWSGSYSRLAPMIMPNDSFAAQLTVPRAGTFIYHTHLNDVEQLTHGLYGAIVVLEPGEKLDPRIDHTFVSGWYRRTEPPRFMLNGDSTPAPKTIAPGRHRLRFVNIGPGGVLAIRILKDGQPVTWTPWAKDGMTLPASRQKSAQAFRLLAVGETFDAMWDATPGEYTLEFVRRAPPGRKVVSVEQRVSVKQ